jgi:hypothetical protein
MKKSASAPCLAPATRLKATFSSVMDLASIVTIMAMATTTPFEEVTNMPLTSIATVSECSRLTTVTALPREKALCLATPDDPSVFQEKDRIVVRRRVLKKRLELERL